MIWHTYPQIINIYWSITNSSIMSHNYHFFPDEDD